MSCVCCEERIQKSSPKLSNMKLPVRIIASVLCFWASASFAAGLTLSRENNWLIIHGAQLPSGQIRINYLEAYCRADSTDADWVKHTVIKHTNELISVSDKVIKMRDRLADRLIVDHTITAGEDEVDFRLVARNPTNKRSEAHWAQPCVRLGDFTGFGPAQTKDDYAYLPKCF